MKKVITRYACLFLLQCFATTVALATETFTLDPQHTYVLWRIKHLGFSTQVGKLYAAGTLTLDEKKPENSKVEATIQVATISTGNAELDKHLKGKLFFNTDEFPDARFVSSKIKIKSKRTADVMGMLTLHGVSKPAIFHVSFNQHGVNPISDKMTVGFSGQAMIKRSDFGMTTLLPGLSDEVKLEIEVEAFKADK